MKKVLVGIGLVVVFGFAGCGDKESTSADVE